jgi:hypothetical protein
MQQPCCLSKQARRDNVSVAQMHQRRVTIHEMQMPSFSFDFTEPAAQDASQYSHFIGAVQPLGRYAVIL